MYNSLKNSLRNGKQRIQEINAGSMADIAFLLLIFFLVTTTMFNDIGIMRKLPPPADNTPPTEFNKRNVMKILVNRDNKLMVRGEEMNIAELRSTTKEFIANPKRETNKPEIEMMYVQGIGNTSVSKKHIISLMSDRGTEYGTYITVQNELTAAYNELRNELALEKFNVPFKELNKEKRKAIEQVYPLHLSEAEPN